MKFEQWRQKVAQFKSVQPWKERLNPRVRPSLNQVSPYHKAFTARFPAELPPAPPVAVVGNITCGNGVGEIGRGSLRALREAGHATAFVDIPCHQKIPDFEIPKQTPLAPAPRVNLFHLNAKDTRYAFQHVGRDFYRDCLNIGYWFWEQTTFPRHWYHAFGPYSEIWVASRFCQSALSAVSPLPVVWMRPLVAPADPPRVTRAQLRWPEDRFVFYFSFDVMSILERKNPLGFIEAYRRAFGKQSQSTCLVLKMTGIPQALEQQDLSDFTPAVLEEVRTQAEAVGGVLMDKFVPRGVANALLAECDCYVSLHRSEGFGLSIAEAMYYGKPTIATAYSAPLDFLTPSNSYPVGYDLVELERDHSVYAAGTVWADPDLDQAAAAMQRIVAEPEAARAAGAQAAHDIRRDYSAAGIAPPMLERMRLALVQQGMTA